MILEVKTAKYSVVHELFLFFYVYHFVSLYYEPWFHTFLVVYSI